MRCSRAGRGRIRAKRIEILSQPAQQQIELIVPADKWRERCAVQRLKPAEHSGIAKHRPGGDRVWEAREGLRAEIAQFFAGNEIVG